MRASQNSEQRYVLSNLLHLYIGIPSTNSPRGFKSQSYNFFIVIIAQ